MVIRASRGGRGAGREVERGEGGKGPHPSHRSKGCKAKEKEKKKRNCIAWSHKLVPPPAEPVVWA